MKHFLTVLACVFSLSPAMFYTPARADDVTTDKTPTPEKKMYDLFKPSLVVVKYTWQNEINKQEFTVAGIIVDEKGTVMAPSLLFSLTVPASQMKDFKIVIPSDTVDPTEVDAIFLGRDDRTQVAFFRAKEPQNWKAVHFVDSLPDIGEPLYSVGILPKGSGYKTHVTTSRLATLLRGPVPQVLVDGDLAGTGSVVADAAGQAIGLVHPRNPGDSLLDNPRDPNAMPMIDSPSKMFIPARFFLLSFTDMPVAGKPMVLPWIGVPELQPLEDTEADYYGLKNVPAAQVGDVVVGSPADKAGLKTLDIITKMNGQPLERGDLPIETPAIIDRQISRMKVGDTVTFSVIHDKGDAPKDITVTLEARPKQPEEAKRYYADDLGFGVRDVVFVDTYARKLPAGTPGVVVALVRQQAPAQAAHLSNNDLITSMNGKPVTDLEQFKKDYQDFRKDHPHDPVILQVSQTNGKDQTINIEPPQNSGGPVELNQ